MAATIRDALTPALLQQVRQFWFEHLDGDDSLVLPRGEDSRRWFFGGEELDRADRFASTLECIRGANVTSGHDIVAALNLDDPCDWLSLVILLDQMPRNCYRGNAARVAFAVFDPLARDVALAAMAAGVPDSAPEIRWQFGYRNWFYLPLMHSEDLATHDRAVEAYGRLEDDVRALASAGAGPAAEPFEEKARRAVQGDPEGALKLAAVYSDFEARHYRIIKRFGRYPHRNKALGRAATREEEAYLSGGGETFGG